MCPYKDINTCICTRGLEKCICELFRFVVYNVQDNMLCSSLISSSFMNFLLSCFVKVSLYAFSLIRVLWYWPLAVDYLLLHSL